MNKLKALFIAGAASASVVASNAMAAIDVGGVTTAIGNAEAGAHSVGTVVIGVVASLAVVGIIIGLVKKL
jgi:hypothetical protein